MQFETIAPIDFHDEANHVILQQFPSANVKKGHIADQSRNLHYQQNKVEETDDWHPDRAVMHQFDGIFALESVLGKNLM